MAKTAKKKKAAKKKVKKAMKAKNVAMVSGMPMKTVMIPMGTPDNPYPPFCMDVPGGGKVCCTYVNGKYSCS